MSRVRWFLIISGLLVLVVFSLSNTDRVAVRMPFVLDTQVPLAMLLGLAAVIGFMIGSLWTAWMLRRRNRPTSGGSSPGADSSKIPGEPPQTE